MNTYKVENFAGHDELVEVVHDLLDAAPVVPPVNVQKVNVRRAQLLERVVHGVDHGLEAVADKGAVLPGVEASVFGRVLCAHAGKQAGKCKSSRNTDLGRDDELVADTASLHPLADELLRAFVLATQG